MIGPGLRFEGFDAASWTNLLSLFAPGVVERLEVESSASDAPELTRGGDRRVASGTLVVVHDEAGHVLKAFHTHHGRVSDLRTFSPRDDLEDACRSYRARHAVAIRLGVLEELAERLALRLSRGEDYLTQWLILLKALREFQDAGLILSWPTAPANRVPIPSPATVYRALNLILPDDHAVVMHLWDRGETWTSVVVRRHAGSIDLVAGPDLVRRWTGPLGGDWRRDHRVIVDSVQQVVAPVHLGVFAEADTLRTLLRKPDAGTWARATAVRDVILQPAPPYVSVALGADAIRAVAATSTRLFGGLDLMSALGPVGDIVRSSIAEIGSVTSTLGFNPLKALAEALQRRDAAAEE